MIAVGGRRNSRYPRIEQILITHASTKPGKDAICHCLRARSEPEPQSQREPPSRIARLAEVGAASEE